MKKGFTLAEILITLGIIGIVAAITIPTLIAKYEEKSTITAVKKNYSIFSQALLMLANEYGSLEALAPNIYTPGIGSTVLKENANVTMNALKKHIKTIRTCDQKTNCMNVDYKTLSGLKTQNWDKYNNIQTGILADGTTFWILNNCADGSLDGDGNPNGNICIQIGFDINGNKKPNIMGEDFFHFEANKNGNIIIRSEEDIYTRACCSCKKSGFGDYNGYHCTDWIIRNENMNYPD